MLRTVADGLEWSYGWQPAAAQRLRFVQDFAYGTGLRPSELVNATLGAIEVDHEERWLHVIGKGARAGRVTLPPLARVALDRYIVQRGLPTTPQMWNPATPLVGNIAGDAGINRARLWVVMKRFFGTVADVLIKDNPAFVDKLRRATPHWMRHTHATHALQGGAELTAVRDNMRHASIAKTSIYLHSDDVKRAPDGGSVCCALSWDARRAAAPVFGGRGGPSEFSEIWAYNPRGALTRHQRSRAFEEFDALQVAHIHDARGHIGRANFDAVVQRVELAVGEAAH